ncbi:MAG TPA: hypothetical protein VKM55_13500 [Candidatus Lokiarchaeia archaeon]|nr:hypothetical protein [Candidatus Lokiarchaeia archaeon]
MSSSRESRSQEHVPGQILIYSYQELKIFFHRLSTLIFRERFLFETLWSFLAFQRMDTVKRRARARGVGNASKTAVCE